MELNTLQPRMTLEKGREDRATLGTPLPTHQGLIISASKWSYWTKTALQPHPMAGKINGLRSPFIPHLVCGRQAGLLPELCYSSGTTAGGWQRLARGDRSCPEGPAFSSLSTPSLHPKLASTTWKSACRGLCADSPLSVVPKASRHDHCASGRPGPGEALCRDVRRAPGQSCLPGGDRQGP